MDIGLNKIEKNLGTCDLSFLVAEIIILVFNILLGQDAGRWAI